MQGAVAVDFGASSGRFAAGTLADGRISYEIIDQIPHSPIERNGRLEWDIDLLSGLTSRAADYAGAKFSEATMAIDTWGVDHGFLNQDGSLFGPPVCYRDESHLRAFEALKEHRPRLYALTGIQHQPFNTICQLFARRVEDASFTSRPWMILPDLLGYLLGGARNHELTQASTSQLLGLDDRWSREAFEIAGWPVPDLEPTRPGSIIGSVRQNVRLATVGGHDTASAVVGFGELADDQIFLNVGTWSLVGCVIPRPIATPEAEAGGFTNERTVDGQVRFLKNIPGFYVINRLHEELGVSVPVPQWLGALTPVDERVDLLNPDLFNPVSMVEACGRLAGRVPASESEWAGLALASLTRTIAKQPALLESLTGRKFRSIRVGGGGSLSSAFCRSLADESGLEVIAGPAEVTVLGNLAVQFLAAGLFADVAEMRRVVGASADVRRYGG